MRSRILQASVLGLVVLAMAAVATTVARADPAARDHWVSKDGKWVIKQVDAKNRVWTLYYAKGETTYQENSPRTDKAVLIDSYNKTYGNRATIRLTATEAEFNAYDKAGKNVSRSTVHGTWK